MALFDNDNRKNGIQMGTIGDECMECKRKHRGDENYEPESLDYKNVYKFWVNNLSHCMCMNCFIESLGDYVLLEPGLLEEDKPKPKKNNNNKKKEEDKDGSKTAKPSEGK